jgi:hypothetical protein
MLQRLLMAVVVVAAVAAYWPGEKDTPQVAATRKKLQSRVTVSFKDTRLEDVVEELKKQVEDLSIWIDNAGGVSNNQTFSYEAQDQPLAKVLDGMFKKTDLGYIIGRKKDKRYDGWLIIKKGKYRGDETDEKSVSKTQTKSAPKPSAPSKPEVTRDEADAETIAARKLKQAKSLDDAGLADKAKARYKEIVTKYPDTKAAKEARQLLEKLDK